MTINDLKRQWQERRTELESRIPVVHSKLNDTELNAKIETVRQEYQRASDEALTAMSAYQKHSSFFGRSRMEAEMERKRRISTQKSEAFDALVEERDRRYDLIQDLTDEDIMVLILEVLEAGQASGDHALQQIRHVPYISRTLRHQQYALRSAFEQQLQRSVDRLEREGMIVKQKVDLLKAKLYLAKDIPEGFILSHLTMQELVSQLQPSIFCTINSGTYNSANVAKAVAQEYLCPATLVTKAIKALVAAGELTEEKEVQITYGPYQQEERTVLYHLKVAPKAGARQLSAEKAARPAGIAAVDKMDGHQFERYCADLLRKLNFSQVKVTRGSGDQGVDITAVKDGVRYAIQCKCYASDLGNTPIQEVNAGKEFYKCHVGAVLTNRHFTSGAKALAEVTGVLLWDRDELIRMIAKAGATPQTVL